MAHCGGDEYEEGGVVPAADAIVDPLTVMVTIVDAIIALLKKNEKILGKEWEA